MTYADPGRRQELITGLRALADFLESTPEVPAPLYADILVFPPGDSDAGKREEIDRIAAILTEEIEISSGYGHYAASRSFGPVEYRAVAIPADETRGQ